MDLNEIYDSINLEKIESYLEEHQEEHLYLEFKTVNSSDLKSRDDRKNLAKAISGFANSSGGIIIWGIRADDKNQEGIDIASGKKLLENTAQFVSKLNEYTGQAVSPLVNGIQHKKIESKDGKGFAVSLIPESSSGPHMAKLGEDRYYKRSGDSFYKMEHYDIADMFGNRPKPNLLLSAKPTEIRKTGRDDARLLILITIINQGRATAKAPFLSLKLPKGSKIYEYGVDGNMNFGLQKIYRHSKTDQEFHFGANSQTVIHPKAELDVCKVSIAAPNKIFDIESVQIGYALGAEDLKMDEEKIEVTEVQIQDIVKKHIES